MMTDKLSGKIKNIRPSLVFCVLIGVLTLFLMIYIYLLLGNEVNDDSSIIQNGAYDVTVGDAHYADADLTALKFPAPKRGEEIVYSTYLKGGDISSPILRVYSRHSLMDVYVGDDIHYSFGSKDSYMYGYGYLTLPLKSDFEGKKLVVHQTVMEDDEVTSLKLPVVYNSDNYMYQLTNSKRLYLFFDIGMVVLGISVIIVSIVFMNVMPDIKKLLWMSVAFCGVGLWVFCSSNLIAIFVHNNLRIKGYLEYLSLYIAPVFFLLYFYDENYKNETSKALKKLYLAVVGIMTVFPVTALILHFTNIRHLPSILSVCHILLGMTFAYALFTTVRLVVLKRFSHPWMIAGTLLLTIVCILDMGNYFMHRYSILRPDSDYNSVMLVGLFLFAICLIVDFFTSQQKIIIMEAKSQALEKIAYVDMMTGLYNRRKCDNEMTRIAEQKGKTAFGIINFDLNDLKKTNDTYGHLEGDELIIDFSNALKEVFGNVGVVGRMGGDEFIVIIEDMQKINEKMLIAAFYEKLDKTNESRDQIRLSGAYGLAVSEQSDLDRMAEADTDQRLRIVQEIYQRADRDMYKHKTEMKAGR